MVCLEIKNKATRDIISKYQEQEKNRVEESGATYQIITGVEEFFAWYDNYMNKLSISET